jgi:hypothetical protein
VLAVLRKECLFANLAKCTFCTDKVVFLGFVVSAQGVEVDEDKIKALREWLPPQNVSKCEAFLDLPASTVSLLKISVPLSPQSTS